MHTFRIKDRSNVWWIKYSELNSFLLNLILSLMSLMVSLKSHITVVSSQHYTPHACQTCTRLLLWHLNFCRNNISIFLYPHPSCSAMEAAKLWVSKVWKLIKVSRFLHSARIVSCQEDLRRLNLSQTTRQTKAKGINPTSDSGVCSEQCVFTIVPCDLSG